VSSFFESIHETKPSVSREKTKRHENTEGKTRVYQREKSSFESVAHFVVLALTIQSRMSKQSASKMIATEDDVDLEAVLQGKPTQMAAAARQYGVKIEQLATFCKVDWKADSGTLSPAELFSEARLEKFFSGLLQQYGPVLSRRKTTLAAVNDALKKLGLPNVISEPHHYPKLHVVLQV